MNNSFYLIAGVLAFVPAILWLTFLLKYGKKKFIQFLIFITGILSVLPIFALQELFQIYPQIDIVAYIFTTFKDNKIALYFSLYVWVGISEEIVKQWLIRFFDKRYQIIETINDSIQFSLVSALGFSFAENIFYFYNIGTQLGFTTLFISFLFRSLFTTCAHLVFSGFFGYYYGIAKFSINIFEQSNFTGKKFFLARFLAKKLNISRFQAYKEILILKGLFIAIFIHMAYDFLLHFNLIALSIIPVIIGFFILRNLLKHKAGNLILLTNPANQQTSTMKRTDEEVVIELIGMWFNQKKFVEVLQVCDRLLKRDPDNKIVQLFKAQALDKIDPENPYHKIISKIYPNTNKPS